MTEDRTEEVRAARGLFEALTDDANKIQEKRVDPDEEYTYIYTPPEAAEIPQEVVERFRSEGYRLGWLAYKDPDGTFKAQQVRLKMKEGYTFVTPEEAPEMRLSFGVGQDIHGSMITNGDLALVKVPYYKFEARRKYFTDQARAREGAHIRDAQRQNNRFAKVLDESKRNIQKIDNFAPNRFVSD